MEQIYWINARDKPAFLVAVMKELSGDESYIEFQGDLSRCDFSDVGGVPVAADVNRRDKGALKVVLALTTGNIKPILKQVLPEARVVHQIENISITKNNEEQLLIGDYFHNECISVGPMLSIEFLSTLKENGIIREIQTDAEAKAKYL